MGSSAYGDTAPVCLPSAHGRVIVPGFRPCPSSGTAPVCVPRMGESGMFGFTLFMCSRYSAVRFPSASRPHHIHGCDDPSACGAASEALRVKVRAELSVSAWAARCVRFFCANYFYRPSHRGLMSALIVRFVLRHLVVVEKWRL